jgi:integrase
MVVRVRLKGLKIARSRGKWYVYHRASGEALIRGFEGSREELTEKLESVETLGAYNARRTRTRPYPEQTLGWLVNWFENEWPGFEKLATATQKQYREAFAYLQPEFDAPLSTITTAALYEARDACAKKKWPRFADKMITAVSSMFTQAVKRKKMESNPALGIERMHKSDANSNREWRAEEWKAVFDRAPLHFAVPMMLARYFGLRGQTISAVTWGNYQSDPGYGKCLRLKVRKNDEEIWIPAVSELSDFLDGLPRTSVNIAMRADGMSWKNEKQLQTAFSNWLKGLQRSGLVAPGLTLHGLRVTYAAWLRREGADASDVAAALGDRTPRMGEHYTRHVEKEARVIRAFSGQNKNRFGKREGRDGKRGSKNAKK